MFTQHLNRKTIHPYSNSLLKVHVALNVRVATTAAAMMMRVECLQKLGAMIAAIPFVNLHLVWAKASLVNDLAVVL
jgi:hypothetical protein